MIGERLTMRMCMTSTITICLVCLVALTGCPRGNNAPMEVVIFDNGSPDYNKWYTSDFHYFYSIADNFVLTTGQETITGIHWWGGNYGLGPEGLDNFTIVIYGDYDGWPYIPDVVFSLAAGDVGQTATGNYVDGFSGTNIYEYSLEIDPLTLVAGKTYYLSIVNNTRTGFWCWATSDAFGGRCWGDQTIPATFVGIEPSDMAFTLTSDGVARAQEARLTQPTRFDSRRPFPYTTKGGGSVYVSFARSAFEYGSNAAVCL